MSLYLLTLPLLAGQALAAAVLTGPAPGAVFYEGSSCIIQWNPDTTGTWKNMTIGEGLDTLPPTRHSFRFLWRLDVGS